MTYFVDYMDIATAVHHNDFCFLVDAVAALQTGHTAEVIVLGIE